MRLKLVLASATLFVWLVAFSLSATPPLWRGAFEMAAKAAELAREETVFRRPASVVPPQLGSSIKPAADKEVSATPLPETVTAAQAHGKGEASSSGACGWERELRIDPAASQLRLGVETYPQTLLLNDREVVLTFDDGPSPATTPAVLQALRDACVHATFFIIGRNAAANPHLARREFDEGHNVGHHSNSHPWFTLRGFDVASGEKDIAAGIDADERAIYGEAARSAGQPHVPFFRFPGFADSPELLRYLETRHIAVFGADLWAADWLMMTPGGERKRVLGLLDRRPHHNGIILFHDTKRLTAEMLPALLGDLKRAHYTIVHLVYWPGAPPPALTVPRIGLSETEKIIARLHAPIMPGAHRL